MALDLNALVSTMTTAGQSLGAAMWAQIETVAIPELQKIATQILAIETHLQAYTQAGAQYLLDMQVRASVAVIAGMTALTVLDVQQAVEQMLAAVKGLVNTAIGFALL